MKGKTLTMIGVIADVVGAILIISHKSITTHGVVITVGIAFALIGVFNMLVMGKDKAPNGLVRVMVQIANIGAVALGVCLLVFASTFVPYVSLVFGVLVMLCSFWQFYLLAVGLRPLTLPAWQYLFPLVLLGGSIYILTLTVGNDITRHDMVVVLSTGISIALLGVACMVEGASLGMVRRKLSNEQSAASDAANTVVETEYKEASKEAGNLPAPAGIPTAQVVAQSSLPQSPLPPQPQKKESDTTDDLDAPLKEE